MKEEPMFTYNVIPGGSYKGNVKDIITIGFGGYYTSQRDLPTGLVYAITAALFDHLDEYYQFHPKGKYVTLEDGPTCDYAAYHPGAIKYFKEKGVWTAEHDARQAKLLAEIGESQ